jgi:hypothetical protein
MSKISKEEKQAKADYEEAQEMDDDVISSESSEHEKNYPSRIMPEDFYQYKKFVNVPEADADFKGLIDKDTVYANLSGGLPNREQLTFRAVTIQWTKEIFVLPKMVCFGCGLAWDIGVKKICSECDKNLRENYIFDEEFSSIHNILKAGFKHETVSSRAIGKDRASILDNMTQSKITKEYTRKQGEKDKNFGFGGG